MQPIDHKNHTIVSIQNQFFHRRKLIHLTGFFFLLLLLTYSACTSIIHLDAHGSAQNSGTPIQIQTDITQTIGKSQFSPGFSYIDDSLDSQVGNPEAVARVQSLIQQSMTYQNTFLMAWGAPDPWPDPNQDAPDNWGYLDNRIHTIVQTGGIPILSLSEAPWWMKGQLEANGSTTTLNQNQEWDSIAYNSRILDDKMDAWLYLIQCAAERYMAPPYNVRIFQVWNELKGYYNPQTKAYDYTDSAGNTSGDNATHGYTYMYNQVYQRLMDVANDLHIARSGIKIGGPYVPITTFGQQPQHSTSLIKTSYGYYDPNALAVLQYWLQHKIGGSFIALDGGNTNDDNKNLTDAFNASNKFADVTRWIRSLDSTRYPGANTLPIWWSEWYAMPYENGKNDAYNNALKAYAIIELIQAGGSTALSWGGQTGVKASDTGLWTDPRVANGGQPRPWFYSDKAIKSDFPPGTPLYRTTISDTAKIAALASDKNILIVNKTATSLLITVNGKRTELQPYQVLDMALSASKEK